ncbi:MAG: band-7 C-terminal domain-containing protein, partial [Myxococcota bacterium]
VQVLEEAGATWGIRVHRYEIKNIQPPFTVQDAMEKQVTAERNRKAMVARAEGEKQSMINRAEGLKQEMINRSEGEMQKRVNEAEGKAAEILALARATAESIEKIAAAVEMEGGGKALKLQLVEKYLVQIRSLAREDAEVLLPIDLGNLEGMLKGLEVNGSLSMPVATSSSGGGGGSYTRRRPASPSAGVPSPSGSDLTLPSSPSRATFSPSSD